MTFTPAAKVSYSATLNLTGSGSLGTRTAALSGAGHQTGDGSLCPSIPGMRCTWRRAMRSPSPRAWRCAASARFCPCFTAGASESDRFHDIDQPLFPGYVFARLDVNRRLPVLVIPGVVRIVGLGKIPVPVDEKEIAAVEAIVESGLLTRPFPFLNVGQPVTIEEGPLRNVTGIVTAIDGADQ